DRFGSSQGCSGTLDSGDGSPWRSDGVSRSGRKPWLASRDDDELARRPSVLHVGMRSSDLVQRVGAVDWDGEAACRNRVEVALEYVGGEVGGFAAVRGEPDARRDVVDRVEVRDGPLVAQHAGEADDAVDGGR